MRHHKLNANQIAAAAGFTDLFVLGFSAPGLVPALTTAPNDFSQGFSNKSIILDGLDIGDVVYPGFAEIKTYVLGPTGAPTISIGVTGTVTQFTNTLTVKSGSLITIPIPLAANMAGPTGAQIAAELVRACEPYWASAATNIVCDCQAGGGDGAAATAGEIWYWCRISRALERVPQGSA